MSPPLDLIGWNKRSSALHVARGAGLQQVMFDTALLDALPGAEALSATAPVADLERALAALEAVDPPLAELLELRFYGGYTDVEVALAIGISERTVRRLWDKARACLPVELQAG